MDLLIGNLGNELVRVGICVGAVFSDHSFVQPVLMANYEDLAN